MVTKICDVLLSPVAWRRNSAAKTSSSLWYSPFSGSSIQMNGGGSGSSSMKQVSKDLQRGRQTSVARRRDQ